MKFEDSSVQPLPATEPYETLYYKDLLKKLLEVNSPHTGTGQRSTYSCFGCKKYPHRSLVECKCVCHDIRKMVS